MIFINVRLSKKRYLINAQISIKKKEIKERLSDYTCFHLQSRSLGKTFVDSLSDSEKLDFIKNGYFFVGDKFCNHVPRYMLNKFLFENYYLKVGTLNPKRLVMTRPTHFFYKNRLEIFKQKVYNMTKKLEDFERNYLPQLEKFTNESEKRNFVNVRNRFNCLSSEEIAEKIVAYAGLEPSTVCHYLTPAEAWFRRYDHYCFIANGKREVIDNVDDLQGIFENGEFCEVVNPPIEVDCINKYYFWMMIIKSRIDLEPDKYKMIEERNTAWIRDSFSSNEVL